MSWIYLLIAGLFEVVWAVTLKYTVNFTKPLPTVLTIAAMAVSFYFLSLALKAIPVGTAYAVWTGIGAAGTALIGLIFLGESREALRVFCILLIIAGTFGLKMTSGG